MKKNVREEMYIEPINLTKKEIKELQEQFPINKQELERLKENRKERLQNKIEMIVIVFFSIVLVGALYLFYLVWNYRFIGVW